MILRRRRRADPVTPAVAEAVFLRDKGCVAAQLDPEHECRKWGEPHAPTRLDLLQLDHVHDGYGMMGKRAPSDVDHLVAVCEYAHLYGWSTSKTNRTLVRWYIGSR